MCLGTLLFCTPACNLVLGIEDFKVADGGPIDARPDANLCVSGGLATFCLMIQPTNPVTIDTPTFDTSTANNCTQIVSQTGGPELCVIAGDQITVNNVVVVTGARPLVLFAIDSITISGTLDLSSKRSPARVGAAGNAGTTLCGTPTAAGANATGGGGGAGGTFGGRGGNGGTGNGGTGTRGVSAPIGTLTLVHGGCPGSKGGNTGGGLAGAGGGAVYMIAGNQILVEGNVFAAGAGGSATTAVYSGGGGGGSGGLIGFQAPMVSVTGIVSANGGGASAGASGAAQGLVGTDGTTATSRRPLPAEPVPAVRVVAVPPASSKPPSVARVPRASRVAVVAAASA